jgi:hypothetical protein
MLVFEEAMNQAAQNSDRERNFGEIDAANAEKVDSQRQAPQGEQLAESSPRVEDPGHPGAAQQWRSFARLGREMSGFVFGLGGLLAALGVVAMGMFQFIPGLLILSAAVLTMWLASRSL